MKWLILTSFVFITACAMRPDPVEPLVIRTKPLERPELVLPTVGTFKSRDIEWIIITPENVDEVFASLKHPVVVFAVTQTGYESLSINTKEALRIILQQQAVIDGYKQYYIITDGSIAAHNASL
jgi:hypothetical protein